MRLRGWHGAPRARPPVAGSAGTAARGRPLPALLAVVALAAALPACGGNGENGENGETARTTGDLQEVQLPRLDVAVSVPRTWSAIDDESTGAEVERFQREHPRYEDAASAVAPAEEGGAVLLAAEPGGDTRVLLSATPVAPGYTLERHVRETLADLDEAAEQQPARAARIEGPRLDLVELAGGDAWTLRLSVPGDGGRVQLLRHTFVRDGLLVVCTYSTLKPYAQAAGLFARSSETIRIGPG